MENYKTEAKHLLAILECLIVFASGFVAGPLAISLASYSPQDVTELQAVPLILQGGTDWGGAVAFASMVILFFGYGVAGCLIFSVLVGRAKWGEHLRRVFFGFFIVFLVLWSLLCLISHFENSSRDLWFRCDFVQIAILFTCVYLISAGWILLLSRLHLRFLVRLLLSPLWIFVFALLAHSGITPKAGKVVVSGEIPDLSSNSGAHQLLLMVHSNCRRCLIPQEERERLEVTARGRRSLRKEDMERGRYISQYAAP